MEGEEARRFATQLAGATHEVCGDFRDGDVGDEPSFSGQLCGALKRSLKDFRSGEIIWNAQVEPNEGRLRMRSLKTVSEEPRLGADIAMILDIQTAHLSIKKGLLAQAKILRRGVELNTADRDRLLKQCDRMTRFTPASVVFLYDDFDVYVLGAAAVLAAGGRNLWKCAPWPILELFYDFGICWIGDRRIRSTDQQSLQDLAELLDVEAAVRLVGRPAAEETRRAMKLEDEDPEAPV